MLTSATGPAGITIAPTGPLSSQRLNDRRALAAVSSRQSRSNRRQAMARR
jgi:hypothetical protein